MSKINLAPKDECTGCAACHDICPVECISMTRPADSLHKFPQINRNVCIECGKCVGTCPILSPISNKVPFNQKYFAAWSEDDSQRKQSTSGGVGAAITTWGIQNGYYICGSSFNSEWQLQHCLTNEEKEADKFRQSKYLQSDTSSVFKEIISVLKAGNKVIFIGTPCQVNGLIKVCPDTLKDQVITVDIICHGVNSPKVWHDYVDYLERWQDSQLTKYNFRDKSKGWERSNGTSNLRVSMSFENGHATNERAVYNQFHYWFGQHYILRDACFNCKYRNPDRVSDITIGDFWGINKIISDVDTFKGVSAVITNSQKGLDLIQACGITVKGVESEEAVKVLRGYIEHKHQSQRNQEIEKMHDFENFYLTHSFDESVRTYKAPSKLSFFIMRVKSVLHI